MVDLPKSEKDLLLEEMTLEELLEHLENMIIKREKITATPIYIKKESREPGPVNSELVDALEQIRATKAMILDRFSKNV